MLVLGRKRSEQVCIGDDIVVTIVRIDGGSVRIGVDAPPTVPIHRREHLDAIKKGSDHGKTEEQQER